MLKGEGGVVWNTTALDLFLILRKKKLNEQELFSFPVILLAYEVCLCHTLLQGKIMESSNFFE